MATVREKIKGQVQDHYAFDKTRSKVGRGCIKQKRDGQQLEVEGHEASFLRFYQKEHARNIHDNLSKLKGESFLRSHFVVQNKSRFWVAVEEIDKSLKDYKNDNPLIWEANARLRTKYQDIIRDIIRGMCQLHQQGLTHGDLSSESIMIIKDRAKLALIKNPKRDREDHLLELQKTDCKQLMEMFADVLGENAHFELAHFHKQSEKVTHWTNLRKLYFHPLLMSCGERLRLVVWVHTRLSYRTRPIGPQIYAYVNKFGVQLTWKCEVKEEAYMRVLDEKLEQKKKEYEDKSWDQFQFGRNTIVHINENIRKENYQRMKAAREARVTPVLLKEKSEAEVDKDLSSMFPEYFTRVYDFFELHEITPSLRF